MIRISARNIFIALCTCLMLWFCLSPFIYMVMVSLSSKCDLLSGNSRAVFTIDNFKDVLTSPSLPFLSYLRNSVIISLLSALLCTFLSSLTAYSVARLAMPGKMKLLFFTLCISMFPQISLLGHLFKLMSGLNWINTYKALIFPYTAWTLPLSLWILVSCFIRIPRDLDRAALVDGCSRLRILFKVILPIARPGIISAFLLAFIFSFNEFMFALMLTIDHKARTVPVAIALFQGHHGELPWGNIMAASVITTLPVVIMAVIYQRHIISGLTEGAYEAGSRKR